MSLLLRHSPEQENLTMDEYGYVGVKDLCSALKITEGELHWIVDNNSKKRFIFGGGHQENIIRATQGHSFEVKLVHEPVEPPETLYHGTAWKNKKSILEQGLIKGTRQHVHMTESLETAEQVGMRYAKIKHNLWIITIDAKKMWEDGYDFYKTENDVWLTDNVSEKFIWGGDNNERTV